MPRSLRFLVATALLAGAATLPATAADEPGKKGVWSTLDLQVYGYVKLDAAYNSSLSNVGNFLRWVDYNPDNPDDDCFHMTINQTRLGLRIGGPEEETGGEGEKKGRLRTSGLIEIDFYGGGAENKPQPQIRHAYANIEWVDSGWEMLAGQTWDVISPLNPWTLNYSVAWWAGNIGFRRPQIRLTKTAGLGDDSEVVAAFAFTRDIGSTSSDFVAADSGTDAGIPGFQARLGFKVGKSRAAGPVSFGISGHWAKEEFDIDEQGDTQDFDSTSIGLDYLHPITPKVKFQLEAWSGENLAVYLGGIGNGVNLDQGLEVRAQGGWLSLDLGPYGPWTWHIGYSLDDPEDEDLEPLDRSRNQSIWATGVYTFTQHLLMGLELSQWMTDYKDAEPGYTPDTYRGQFSVIYRF